MATNLAYPVGDLVLLGMVTGGVALTGWKPGVTWGALAVSFLIFGVSDGIYLIGNARGTWEAGSLVEAGWPAATLLLAWAAWMRPQDKPGRLDPDEWAFIARHTLIGERILGAAEALPPVACLVRSSHEHFDGNGYPDGLRGTEIPLGARIVAVCDAYDAMTSDRPYRSRMTHAEAIAELQRCAGSQFDPVVVRAFCAAEHSAAGLAATPGV